MNVSGVPHPIDGPPPGTLTAAKRAIKRTVASRWMAPAWAPLIRNSVTFLMLHRFAEPDLGLYGHDREHFRGTLERLRREGYEMLGVDAAVRRLIEGQGFPKRTVVFTMDDGYRGALEQSADIFLAYDCPLTTFVTTGFIDGTSWFWWDQIEHVCLRSGRSTLDVDWNGTMARLDMATRRSTITSLLEVCRWCKTLPDEEKWEFIRRLAEVAGVDIPAKAPPEYAPLTWSELRAFEKKGFSFGPHTVTHPILTRTSDAQSEHEITESWTRVRTELARPVGILAYPNGSYGEREIETVKAIGLTAAMSTRGAYASPRVATGSGRYEIPRFGYPETEDPVFMIASGFKSLDLTLDRLRKWRARG